LAYTGAVAAGNTLVLTSSGDPAFTISSVTDSVNGVGNPWTKAISRVDNFDTECWYFINTGAGTPTVTVNMSGSPSGQQITLYEIHTTTCGATIARAVTNNNQGSTGVSDAGPLNTTVANAILIAATENNIAESTAGASFTFLNSVNGFKSAGSQFRIVTSTSNYSSAFGTDTGDAWTAVAAAFKEVTAGGPQGSWWW